MKLRFGSAAALAGAFFMVSSPALAQDEVLKDSIYLRIGGGVSFVSEMDQDITPPSGVALCLAIGCNPDRRVTDFDNGYFVGAALGFDYADGIRTELEYRYASADVDSVAVYEGAVEVAPAGVGDEAVLHFLMSNFYFDFANSSALTPFIGGGVGGAFMENDLGQRDAALAYQGRAGVSLGLGGGFLADVEYIYTRTNNFVFDEPPSGAALAATLSGDRYAASNVMVSLRKNF